jgi:lipoprotein-anchoring transpeptidase ErfK/SrfK
VFFAKKSKFYMSTFKKPQKPNHLKTVAGFLWGTNLMTLRLHGTHDTGQGIGQRDREGVPIDTLSRPFPLDWEKFR